MIREPAEVMIDQNGRTELPMGLLAEAGIAPGSAVIAFSRGDGRIVLRRADDALSELMETGTLT